MLSVPKRYDEEDIGSPSWAAHNRHFFILSSAGKPIFARFGDESKLAGLAGVLQALVSVIAGSGDKLRHMRSGAHTAAFLTRGPVYLVAVSSGGDSVSYLMRQLNCMHAQIISILTSKIEDIFVRNASYDLRSLLGGTDRVLRHLIHAGSREVSFLVKAVPTLRLLPADRAEIGKLLASHRPPELLFAVLLGREQLVQLLHPKKRPLHPVDLLLIRNAVISTSSFREGESWLPICLPRYNQRAFVYAHVSFVGREMPLVLISASRDAFAALSAARAQVMDGLRARGMLAAAIERAIAAPLPDASEPGVAEVQHFICKQREHQQCTHALWGTHTSSTCPYRQHAAIKKLLTRYQLAHARVHATRKPLRELYLASDSEVIISRCTPEYELYIVFGPLVTKPIADAACNRVLKWVKREERALFLGPG